MKLYSLIGYCSIGDLKEVKLMIERGIDINNPDGTEGIVRLDKFATPLVAAVNSRNIDLIKYLLDAGADVNYEKDLQAPLPDAYSIGNEEIIKLLIEYGALEKDERLWTNSKAIYEVKRKMQIQAKEMLNIIFLDTEVHSLESPILIQLAYKRAGRKDSVNQYYSTGGILISHGAMGVHHITESMIEGKEVFSNSEDKEVLQNKLIQNILVAHNAKFDIGVLNSHGVNVPKYICTLKLAHYLFPELENYKLQTLRYIFGLELGDNINPHDAMSDVLVLEKLFWKLYKDLSNKTKINNPDRILEEMILISERPILQVFVPFGKYKGKKWSNVPIDYIDWVINKSDFHDEDIIFTCRYYLSIKDKIVIEDSNETIGEKSKVNPNKTVENETNLFGNIVALTFFIGPILSVIIAGVFLGTENARDNWFIIWIGLLVVSIILWSVFKKK